MREASRNRKRTRGFTLLEVMVAVSILSISGVVAMQIISMAMRNIAKTKDYSMLAIAAENEMELLLAKEKFEEKDSVEVERDDYTLSYSVVLLESGADETGAESDGVRLKNGSHKMFEVVLNITDKKSPEKRNYSLTALKFVNNVAVVKN